MSTNYISQITASNGTTYDIQEGVTTRIFRATCSTAAATAAKVATLDDATGYSLAAGVRVAVTFTYGNSADTPTLNVNSGGAKTIVIPTTTISTNYSSDKSYTSWGQYETIIFTYNGTYWITSGSSYILYKAYSSTTSLLDYTDGTNVAYYIPFTYSSGVNDKLTSAYVSPNFTIVDSQTSHLATLNLGNSLGSDETTYRRGALRLYSQTGKYVKLETKDTLSTNGTIYFPDYISNNATIATTEDIPSITLNGSSTTSPSFYAPTGAGTSGYYLKSNGSGAPSWASITIPTITLNGSATTSPSFYAPTSAGTSNYYLKSNGSGAPTWSSIATTDEKVKQENTTGTDTYRILFSYNANDNTETVPVRKSKDLKFTTTTGNLQTIQLNGVTVGSSPKFTDSEVSTLTLASGSTAGTSLSFGSKYTLTAGSKTVSFTMPSSPTVPTITLNGSATTSPSFYAPTSAGTSGYVLKSNGSGAPSWGSAILTDKKLEVAEVTTNTIYYPIVGTGASASTRQYDTTGFKYSSVTGTSSTMGCATITLGNSTPSGTAGNKVGQIQIYGRNNNHITFEMADVETSTNCYLPNKTGTIALTSDIPDDNYFLNLVYPVGAIYISTVSTSPENLFGGTWVQIKDRFLLAAGDTYAGGATGGEATHKLTAAESGVPAHGHGFTQPSVTIGTHQHIPNTGSTTTEYFVTTEETSANNTRVTYSSSGNRWVDGLTEQSHFHHRVATTAADLGTKTATGGAVQNNTAANATNAHNNMPPYLAVYVWKRTA